MEALWNKIELERPPNTRWRIESHKFGTANFLNSLDKVIQDLESQDSLQMEAAILSRLIYRMKSKFRNDKGLKCMSKVNRGLLNYLRLSLEKEYKNLKNYVEYDGTHVSLPSKQMLEYVLVRTQGFAKLLTRVEQVASCSAHFFKTRMSVGHAWSISVVAYAVISRIWILTRHLIKKCCTWYDGFYRYLKVFKSVGLRWLPEDYEIPADLKSWLNLTWLDEMIPSLPTDANLKNVMFKLISTGECASDDQTLGDFKDVINFPGCKEVISGAQNKSVIPNSTQKNSGDDIISIDDVGEVISRHNFGSARSEKRGNSNVQLINKKRRKQMMEFSDNHRRTINLTHAKPEAQIRETSKDKHSKKQSNVESRVSSNRSKVSARLILDDVKCTSDLSTLLNMESYPGLDKLRWNMIRKKSRKCVETLNNQTDKNEETRLLKKTIHQIRRWID